MKQFILYTCILWHFAHLCYIKKTITILSHILFAQVEQLSLHYFAKFIKVKRGNKKWVNTLELMASVEKLELR